MSQPSKPSPPPSPAFMGKAMNKKVSQPAKGKKSK